MPKKCNATIDSKPCDKSSFATCDGCQLSFCLPHLNIHQQQLNTQMEEIVRVHDLLHEELNQHFSPVVDKLPEFAREFSLIDAWQTRTLAQVTKQIAQEADRARNVVHHFMEENCRRAKANEAAISEDSEQLKKRLTILSEQLQARVKTSDYLEPDLRQWDMELSDIKQFSLTSPVPKYKMVDKLAVGERKQMQFDVSNILGIEYVDADRVEEKVVNAYNYVAEKVSEAANAIGHVDYQIGRRARK